ncbi:unnamed protein product [Fusarium venenatum]|uniref:Uncharacterized protein n=1 Tax=Fusarium venenatum TaxID=56646 RepID=A0A2L2T5X6_9HYPO|nr:uncharacterized protein FVRRES_07579 [Fusarium venenatum]CEI63143.1 unnamed protein product [Fusarium venenatum]
MASPVVQKKAEESEVAHILPFSWNENEANRRYTKNILRADPLLTSAYQLAMALNKGFEQLLVWESEQIDENSSFSSTWPTLDSAYSGPGNHFALSRVSTEADQRPFEAPEDNGWLSDDGSSDNSSTSFQGKGDGEEQSRHSLATLLPRRHVKAYGNAKVTKLLKDVSIQKIIGYKISDTPFCPDPTMSIPGTQVNALITPLPTAFGQDSAQTSLMLSYPVGSACYDTC